MTYQDYKPQGKEAAMIPAPRNFKALLNNIASAVGREAIARRIQVFFAAAILVIGVRSVSAVL